MRLALALICLPALAEAGPSRLAYWFEPASTGSLNAEAGVLATVAADAITINAQGLLSGAIPAKVAQIAAAHHLTLLAVVSNYDQGFKSSIATAILTPGAAQDAAVSNILRLAQSVAGINLDFEGVLHTERNRYTAFVARLGGALHQAGRTLTLSVPAKTADDPGDSWSGAYDYAALAPLADTLQIMTYDQNGPWGPPGPVAGLDWVAACLTYTETVVPRPQISLGMPAYGYDWDTTKGGGVTLAYRDVPALLHRTGATTRWDAAVASPWFAYTDGKGDAHVVWYENARSIGLKSALANTQNVGSVSVWALGLDDRQYWKAIQNAGSPR